MNPPGYRFQNSLHMLVQINSQGSFLLCGLPRTREKQLAGLSYQALRMLASLLRKEMKQPFLPSPPTPEHPNPRSLPAFSPEEGFSHLLFKIMAYYLQVGCKLPTLFGLVPTFLPQLPYFSCLVSFLASHCPATELGPCGSKACAFWKTRVLSPPPG